MGLGFLQRLGRGGMKENGKTTNTGTSAEARESESPSLSKETENEDLQDEDLQDQDLELRAAPLSALVACARLDSQLKYSHRYMKLWYVKLCFDM